MSCKERYYIWFALINLFSPQSLPNFLPHNTYLSFIVTIYVSHPLDCGSFLYSKNMDGPVYSRTACLLPSSLCGTRVLVWLIGVQDSGVPIEAKGLNWSEGAQREHPGRLCLSTGPFILEHTLGFARTAFSPSSCQNPPQRSLSCTPDWRLGASSGLWDSFPRTHSHLQQWREEPQTGRERDSVSFIILDCWGTELGSPQWISLENSIEFWSSEFRVPCSCLCSSASRPRAT